YVEDCIADRPSEDNIPSESDQIHQHGSTIRSQKAMEPQEREPTPLEPTLSEDAMVACPEC
ncbi:hypothetical protein BGZ70_002345, partial [Mortierella alpina]